MIKNKKHPFFFTDVQFADNIVFVDRLEEYIPKIDLIILAIPNQFILPCIREIKHLLSAGVRFLNLSK
jgi:glycerol-3-phosphate dehydrogenase